MTVHAGSTNVDLLFQWGSSLNLLAANNSNTVLILCEHLMSAHYSQQMAAVQLTPTQLSVAQFSTGAHLPLLSDTHIKGVCASKVNVLGHATWRKECGLNTCVLLNKQDSVTVWSGKQVTVYELSGTTFNIKGKTLKLMPDGPISFPDAWLSLTNFPSL